VEGGICSCANYLGFQFRLKIQRQDTIPSYIQQDIHKNTKHLFQDTYLAILNDVDNVTNSLSGVVSMLKGEYTFSMQGNMIGDSYP